MNHTKAPPFFLRKPHFLTFKTMQQQDANQSVAPAWDLKTSKGKWNKVMEKTQDGKGTFCVAKEKINQGEPLLTEEPFLRQIHDKYKKTRCNYCFKELKDITTRSCRGKECQWEVKYCSQDCEGHAWTRGHQWLCSFPELSKLDADIVFAVKGYFVSKSQNQGTVTLSHKMQHGLTLD